MAEILKGAPVAAALSERLFLRIQALKEKGVEPCLAVVRVGVRDEDLAYERGIEKRCEKLGVCLVRRVLDENASQEELLSVIDSVNKDNSVQGCLMMRPLPKHMDEDLCRNALSCEKDIDGITDSSLAGVFTGSGKGFPPCTAAACIEILDHYGVDLAGKNAVVVGRSLVVGKPLAMLLMARNATVTVCHTRTQDLAAECRRGDILLAAAGRAGVIKKGAFASGQVIIDVGINSDGNGGLVGDVDTDAAMEIAAAVTPVPGGVGAVTTTVLVKHLVEAAERSLG